MNSLYKRKSATQLSNKKSTTTSNSLSAYLEQSNQLKAQAEEISAYKQALSQYKQDVAEYEAYMSEQNTIEQEQIALQEKIDNANFFERVGSTLLDIPLKLTTGIFKANEGILDLVMGLNPNWQDKVERNLTNELLNEKWGFDELAQTSYLRNNTGESNFGGKVLEGVGQIVPTAVASYFGGGTAGLATMGTSAAGSGMEEAYNDGATYGQALGYGVLSGAVEIATEKLWSVMGASEKLFGQGVLSKNMSNLAKKPVTKFLLGMATEGVEEAISEAVNPLVKYITYEKAQGKTWEDIEVDSGAVIESFLIGAVSAGILEGGNIITSQLSTGSYTLLNALSNAQETNLRFESLLDQQGGIVNKTQMQQFALEQESNMNDIAKVINNMSDKRYDKVSNKALGNNELFADFNRETKQFNNQQFENLRSSANQLTNDNIQYIDENRRISVDVKEDFAPEKFNELQQVGKAFIDFNRVMGLNNNLVITDNADYNGMYDPNTNTIYVNLNSTDGILYTFGHEFTHSLEGRVAYEELLSFFLSEKSNNDILKNWYNEKFKAKYRQYNKASKEGKIQGYENLRDGQKERYINEELLGDFIGEHLIRNEDYLKTFAKENKTLANKVLDFVKEKLGLVKKQGFKDQYSTEMQELLTRAETMLTKAIEQTELKRTETRKNSTEKNVRYSDNIDITKERESQYRRTFVEATDLYLDKDAISKLESAVLVYEFESNKDLIAERTEELSHHRLDTNIANVIAKLSSTKRLTNADTVDAILTMQQASKQGRSDAIVEIIDKLSTASTNAGKFIQALSIIKRLSPEGRLITFKKTLDKINEKNEKNRLDKNKKASKKIIETRKKYFNRDVAITKDLRLKQVLTESNIENSQYNVVFEKLSKLDIDLNSIATEIERINNELQEIIADDTIRQKIAENYVNGFNQDYLSLENQYSSTNVLIPISLAEDLLNSKTQDEITKSAKKIQVALNEQTHVSWFEKMQQWRYLAMLANPKTHLRNITSNMVMQQVAQVKDKIAARLETIATKKGLINDGERTRTTVKPTKAMTLYSQNVAIAAHQEYSESISKYNSLGEGKTVFQTKALEKIRKLNNDLLENVEDRSAFIAVFQRSFAQWATANNYTITFLENHPQIAERGRGVALQEALENTFKDYSALVSTINQIKSKNRIYELAISSTIPFTKTPINIARRALEYSPVGLAKSIADYRKVKNGKLTATQWINNMSKGMTGSMITLLGYFLASACFVTGGNDNETTKETNYKNTIGKKAFSVKIGDKYYTLDWLAPASIPFFTGVAIYDSISAEQNVNKTDFSEFADIITGMLDPLTEMSFLRSLNDALSSYDENKFKGIGENMLKSFVSSFIPTISSQIAKSIDTTRRTTATTSDSTYFANYLIAKIPFLAETLEPYIDVWGNEDKEANLFTRLLENMVYPFWVYENKANSTVDIEIQRLYNTYGNSEVLPSIPKYYYTKNGERIELSSEDYTQFKKDYGTFSFNSLQALFYTSFYKNLTDEEKEQAISKVYSYARDYAKKGDVYALSTALNNNSDYYLVNHLINLSNISGSKNSSGNTITGSKKQQTFAYINSIKNLSKAQKYLLFGYVGYASNDKYTLVVDYVNSLSSLSDDQKLSLLQSCGFSSR